MKKRSVWMNVGFLIVIAGVGVTVFAENVRNVQIVGLFASGTAFGVSLSMIFAALGMKRRNAEKAEG